MAKHGSNIHNYKCIKDNWYYHCIRMNPVIKEILAYSDILGISFSKTKIRFVTVYGGDRIHFSVLCANIKWVINKYYRSVYHFNKQLLDFRNDAQKES